MTVSILLNSILVVLVAGACIAGYRKDGTKWAILRYFTVLSNLFCAAASLTMVIFSLAGEVPEAVRILKYTGTCAVTVTFLTVMLFLLPVTRDYVTLLSGSNFFLHLISPVLAAVSWIFFESSGLEFYVVIFGTLPVVLYGGVYLYKVLLAPPEKRWEDFYGFNRGGKWPISIAAMICAAFGISVLLWAV